MYRLSFLVELAFDAGAEIKSDCVSQSYSS